MNKFFVLALIGVVFFITEIHAGCLCKAKGSTLCDCDASFVKPKSKPCVHSEQKTVCTTYGARELHPIGDLCGCGHVHVEPAKVEPSCSSSCSCSKCSSKHSSHHSAGHTLFEESHKFDRDFPGSKYDFAPDTYEYKQAAKKKAADTTSIILAFQEQERCNHHVPESKLHYGYFGKIKDGYTKKVHQDLKEGHLHRVVGEPISLKRCDKHKPAVSEESEESEEDTFVPLELGYADIGYGKHKYSERSFTKHYAAEKSHECKDKVLHVKTKGSGCGCNSRSSNKHEVVHHYSY